MLGNDLTTNSYLPVDVDGLSSDVLAVSAGQYHACALTTEGGAKCWGYNGYGQLGDNTTSGRSTSVNVLTQY